MYISRSFIASALLGFSAATTHAGEMGASTAVLSASKSLSSTAALSASESLSATAAAASAAATGEASAGDVATHVIQVGGPNGSTIFSPNNVKANVGDLVQFQFHPKNHSVVQSTFDQPCTPIQNVVSNMTTAFFSGFMPTNSSAGTTSQVLTYTIRVMDAKPVWFYCSQAKHCQAGMVGAINAAATGNKTLEAFKALAGQATENLSPGQVAGQGTGSGSSSSGTEAASSAASGAGAASPTSSSESPAQQSTNAAPGLYHASRQSLFGLTAGALVAFMAL